MTALTRRRFFALSSIAALTEKLSAEGLSRFPLAVTTDEIDDDLLTAARFLDRFGLKYAEIRGLWGAYNTAQPLPKIRAARQLLDQHGIETCVLDTGFFKIPLPGEGAPGKARLDQQWALLEAAMERASILGTKKIRIFAFMYPKDSRPDEKQYPRIFDLVREAAQRAKARNFQLALENVGGSYVSTAEQAARLLDAISDPALGLTWDPNNSAASGGEAFPEGYRRLDPSRIVHVHLRDYRRLPGGKTEWCVVGEGEFDHLGQLRALVQDHYAGTLSLETHCKVDGSKMKASEASLRVLLKVIDKV